ncbi:MAG: hypothetical protein VKL23_06935 [Cyanobacteriota bacterium]|nr:hypothetical protein [Cyanobacteriota bacterium]
MKLSRHPLVFLVGTNLLLWGLAFSANHIQSIFANFSQPGSRSQLAGVPSGGSQPATASPLKSAGVFPSASDSLFRDPLLFDLAVTDGGEKSVRPSKVQVTAQPSPGPRIRPTAASLSDQAMLITDSTDHFFAQLTKADGLGGEVSLKTMSEPLMPIAAKVERLQHQRSSDTLSALPLHWREPLRQELAKRPSVSKVATVRIPVQDLADRYEVPVIIDENGQAEGLTNPQNAKVQAAVEKWMTRQKPSRSGTVSVMVVSAEPLQEKPPAPDQLLISKTAPATDPLPVSKPIRSDLAPPPVSRELP